MQKDNYLKRSIFTMAVCSLGALAGAYAGWRLMLCVFNTNLGNVDFAAPAYLSQMLGKISLYPLFGAIFGMLAILLLLAVMQGLCLCFIRAKAPIPQAPKRNLTAKKRASR